MKIKEGSKFDVIIIGSGISSLVCGCYLAKAGMKVLIIEKNSNFGGASSSFEENGYRFNFCIHSLGSYGEGGTLNKILKQDLKIEDHVKILRKNPSSTIITDELRFDIYSDKNLTKEILKKNFSGEANNIDAFFEYVFKTDTLKLFWELKNSLCTDLLDRFFQDDKLKRILKIPTLTIGSSLKYVPAFSFVIFYRDYLFDSGYYAIGGMQAIVNGLINIFTMNGGQVLNYTTVKKINVLGNFVTGVTTNEDQVFFSNFVVSGIDAKKTFLNLLGLSNIKARFLKKIRDMSFCYSAFILYLGVHKSNFIRKLSAYSIWYSPLNNVDGYLNSLSKRNSIFKNQNLLLFFPSLYEEEAVPIGSDSICIISLVPYYSVLFWRLNKIKFRDVLIKNVKNLIPDSVSSFEFEKMLTPIDLEAYTSGHKGAIKGWASTLNNNLSSSLPYCGVLKNLFTVGHWSTMESGQGGVTMAAASGNRAARSILRQEKDRHGI